MWGLNTTGIPKEELKSVFTTYVDRKGKTRNITLKDYTNSLLNEYFDICTCGVSGEEYNGKVTINNRRSAYIDRNGFYDFIGMKMHFKKWAYDSLFEMRNLTSYDTKYSNDLEESIVRVFSEINALDRFCNFFNKYFPGSNEYQPDDSFYHVSYRKEMENSSNNREGLESKL